MKISEPLTFQLSEHAEALHRVRHQAGDILNLHAQYQYLQFVMDSYPDAVMKYLTREQQHFEGLARQTSDISLACYVNQVAERIFNYSMMGKILNDILTRGYKPGGPGGNVFEKLLELTESEKTT